MNATKIENKIKYPIYTRMSRGAFWGGALLLVPFWVYYMLTEPIGTIDWIVLAFYVYVVLVNYVGGFCLENPPLWSKYIIPKKWIDEWKQLSYGEVKEKKANDKQLALLICACAIGTIVFLAMLTN